jgi:hypothetical protein
LSLATLGVLATVNLALPVQASAIPTYAAGLGPECCSETLESGATERQFFTLTNLGTATWGAAGGPTIALGTYEPQAASVLAAPDWPSAERPVVGVSSPVSPGASYKFMFDVKAPLVSAPTTITQHYGLVAETPTLDWMTAKSRRGPQLTLTYDVLPAQPPTVSLQLSSST